MSGPYAKSRDAAGAIAPYRIIKHGATDYAVLQAAAATDAICGVTQQLGAAQGQRVDVAIGGVETEVEYGGIVTRGDPLTSDANGKAVKAVPVAGQVVRTIGFADVSGVAGDVVPFTFALGVIATPAAP
jgi:hypothetical protein